MYQETAEMVKAYYSGKNIHLIKIRIDIIVAYSKAT